MAPFNDFGLTEQQKLIRENVLGLVRRVLPDDKIRALDAAGEFPFEAFAALAEAGWMGLPYAAEHGGMGGSAKDLAVFVEAVAEHYSSLASAWLTTTIYAGKHIELFGTPEQRARFLPGVIAGRTRLALALSEPEAGSDAASIRTRAELRDGRYVVTGQKLYITCAHVAHHLVTVVKTDPGAGRRGISILIVDADAKGVTVRPMETLGRRTTRACEVFFDGVEVALDRRIGPENGAWRNLVRCLNLERLCLAAAGAGNLRHVLAYALDYAQGRKAFGRTITEYQAVSHKLADIRIMAETARLCAYRAAEMLDAGLEPDLETSIAKVVATDNDFRGADLGLQIMGGAGYTMAHDMQRMFRDSRVGTIGGGSNEIQRNIIARLIGA
ncbi:MAG: acyl-CoA dehydrogenase [Alphaproteobacteria bacterium]|nr:acyl-CoA dehydrogenase [Alphaproteobacteria bacterium]